MGCRCCRMIKSYIYDPSVAVDVRKSDSTGSSLYQPHHIPGGAPGNDPHSGHNKQKQGFHNLAYSKSNESTLKLEADNNHVNHRLHAAPSKEVHLHGSAPPTEDGLYIIQPEARWVIQEQPPSQVPVYPNMHEYEMDRGYGGDRGHRATRNGWDSSITGYRTENLSVDEIDEGVGGTPEYPCDTGDKGSILSVDIHTSTTSLSSGDDLKPPQTLHVSNTESNNSVMKKDKGTRNEDEEVQSVTDSMVAEALAALEAATAGEDYE